MRQFLNPTGGKIAFLDVAIGAPFFAHDKIWIRTSYEAATELVSSGNRMGSCCNFTIDECDKIVGFVAVERRKFFTFWAWVRDKYVESRAALALVGAGDSCLR